MPKKAQGPVPQELHAGHSDLFQSPWQFVPANRLHKWTSH